MDSFQKIPAELLINIIFLSNNICCFLVCKKWNLSIKNYNYYYPKNKMILRINNATEPKLVKWFVENYQEYTRSYILLHIYHNMTIIVLI